MSARFAWTLRLAVLAAIACDGPGDGADAGGTRDAGALDAASPDVTPEAGGTVVSDDGLATLVIPPGAVDAPVAVRVRRVPDDELPDDVAQDETHGRLYDLAPDGLAFATPARLTVVASPEELARVDFSAPIVDRVLFSRQSDGAIEPLANGEMVADLGAGTITLAGDVAHFSGAFAVDGIFEASLTPREIDTVAPDMWTATAELATLELLGETPATRAIIRYNAGILVANPPPLHVSRTNGFVRGVVRTDMPETVVGMQLPPTEPFSESRLFRCDVDGFGEYGIVVLAGAVATDGGVQLGTYIRLIRPARCRMADPPPPVAVGVHDTVASTEAITYAAGEDVFGVGVQAWALAAGAGTAVHDLASGAIAYDFGSATAPSYRVQHVRWEDGTDTLVSNGPDGYAVRPFIPSMSSFGFAFLGAIGRNVTDVDPLASTTDPSRARAALIVDNASSDVVEVTRDSFGTYMETTMLPSTALAAAGVSGRTVSVHPTTDGEGHVGVTETDLYFYDGATVTALGTIGTGLRLIDCAARICAVADFVAGETIFFPFDGTAAPDLTTLSRAPIPGAVTVDVREDGRVLVPSSSTRAVHRLTLDAFLSVSDDVVCAVESTAVAPFHVSGIRDTEIALVDHGADGQLEIVDFMSCAGP